jgi:N-acyl-D-aspartate/D-glutamate deacylase
MALQALMRERGQGLGRRIPSRTTATATWMWCGEMRTSDATVLGLSDAGAHVGLICDGAAPTFRLQNCVPGTAPRGASRSNIWWPSRPVATPWPARTAGDRGLIAPGMKADINPVDHAALALQMPRVVADDLPAGGRRFIQRAHGYRHTFVSASRSSCGDQLTGRLPGSLIGAAPGSVH